MAEQSTKDHVRGLLLETQLASPVIDEFATWLRDPRTPNGETFALLFGRVTDGVANIQALAPLPLANLRDGGGSIGDRLGRALDEYLVTHQARSTGLLGWSCVRPVDDLRRLGAELEFHNRRFRRSTDLFLVLPPQVSRIECARLYAKSCDLPVSEAHHRTALVAFPGKIPSVKSASLTPSEATANDLYLNSYRVARELDAADKQRDRRAALRLATILKQWISSACTRLRHSSSSASVRQATSPTSLSSSKQLPEEKIAGNSRRLSRLTPLVFLLATIAAIVVTYSYRTLSAGPDQRPNLTGEVDHASNSISEARNPRTEVSTKLGATDPRDSEKTALVGTRPIERREYRFEVPRRSRLENPAAGPQSSQTTSPTPSSTEVGSTAVTRLPTYTPPRPEKTVTPNLAPFDRSQLAGLHRITVEVYIDDSGRVVTARPSNLDREVATPVLGAFLSAARGWVFNPAQRGGKNVPSWHAIVFRLAGS